MDEQTDFSSVFVYHLGGFEDALPPDTTTSPPRQTSTQRLSQQGQSQQPIRPQRRQRTEQERQQLKQHRKARNEFLHKGQDFEAWEREKGADYSYEELEEMQRKLFKEAAREREERAIVTQGVAKLGLERQGRESFDEMEVDGAGSALQCERKVAGMDGDQIPSEERAGMKKQPSDSGVASEHQRGSGGSFALPFRGANDRPW